MGKVVVVVVVEGGGGQKLLRNYDNILSKHTEDFARDDLSNKITFPQ